MPMIKIHTSVNPAGVARAALMADLSARLAAATGKPERYVMVVWEAAEVLMAGKPGPGAFVDVRGIGGLDGPMNKKLSAEICGALHDRLAIPRERIYLNFQTVPASNWGWNGDTFG